MPGYFHEGGLRKQSFRSGIGEVEYIARNEVSTIRNLYRSRRERFPWESKLPTSARVRNGNLLAMDSIMTSVIGITLKYGGSATK